jgi:hypothetical protein
MRECVQFFWGCLFNSLTFPARSFARLVVQKDRELFGTQEFSAIPRKAILLPTDDNVQTEMSRAARAHTSSAEPFEELANNDLFV